MIDQIKLLLGIIDNKQDDLLELLIGDSRERLTAFVNIDSVQFVTLPDDVDWILRDLTVKRFNRLGDEGKKSSSESSVTATWNADDLSEYAPYLDKYRHKKGGKGIARFI